MGTCVLCCMDEEEDVEHVLLRCGAYAEERRKPWSVLEDCVGWWRGRRYNNDLVGPCNSCSLILVCTFYYFPFLPVLSLSLCVKVII